MTTLYQINADIARRLDALQERLDNGETLPPTDDEVQALLGLIEGDLTDKLINYGKFIKNQQSDIDGLDGEIKRLTAKKRALQNRTDLLKSNMLMAMRTVGIERINDPIMPIRIQANSKASVMVANAETLPKEFQIIKIEANKTALEQAIQNGASFDGVSIEKGEHIRIG